jgi:hypothetical protein
MVAPPGNRVGIGVERDRQGSVTLAFVDFKANRRAIPSPQQNRDTARDNKRLDALPQRVEQRCYHSVEMTMESWGGCSWPVSGPAVPEST